MTVFSPPSSPLPSCSFSCFFFYSSRNRLPTNHWNDWEKNLQDQPGKNKNKNKNYNTMRFSLYCLFIFYVDVWLTRNVMMEKNGFFFFWWWWWWCVCVCVHICIFRARSPTARMRKMSSSGNSFWRRSPTMRKRKSIKIAIQDIWTKAMPCSILVMILVSSMW